MTTFDPNAATVWQDTEGGLAYNPEKGLLRTWGGGIEEAIKQTADGLAALQVAQTSDRIIVATWAGLSSVTGTFDGQGAEVPPEDTGDHAQGTATGYDGDTVENAGLYSWHASWGVWVWVSANAIASKANQAEVDTLTATVAQKANSEDLGSAAAADAADFATSAQGEIAQRLGETLSPEDGDGLALLDQHGNVGALFNLAGIIVEKFSLLAGADSNVPLMIRNAAGDVVATIEADGTISTGGGLTIDRSGLSSDASEAFLLARNSAGEVAWYIGLDGKLVTAQTDADPGDAEASDEAALALRDAENQAISAAAAQGMNLSIERVAEGYNVVVTYGQSLSTGMEGWPNLLTTASSGALMVGSSVRGTTPGVASWTPTAPGTLQPLASSCQDNSTGAFLDATAQAALTDPDNTEGETLDVGAVNTWRRLWLDQRGISSDPDRLMVAVNTGVANRAISRLSKGASPELYQRPLDAVQAVKDLADAASVPCRVVAIFYAQGESDIWDLTDKATYKAALLQLRNDLVADLSAITGQTRPPAFITYQTCASFVKLADVGKDAALQQYVAMAQLELAEEQDHWYMAGPASAEPDKGGHMPPNGYRELGQRFGAVAHRIVDRGEDWLGLRPRQITWSGSVVTMDFLVPSPPLTWGISYDEQTARDFATKGFKVFVNGAEQTISSVSIVSATQVQITTAAPLSGSVTVSYAGKDEFDGVGNLCDSSSFIARDRYVYDASSGQLPGENIPELINKPYPSQNWCVGFFKTATQEA